MPLKTGKFQMFPWPYYVDHDNFNLQSYKNDFAVSIRLKIQYIGVIGKCWWQRNGSLHPGVVYSTSLHGLSLE